MNEAIKFIFIGIDVLTLVCMIFYLIRGFKKGVIKSVIDVVVKLILLILSFVIAKPLATKLVGSKITFITGDQTVNEFVKTQVANSMFDGNTEQMTSTGLDVMTEDILISVVQLLITVILSFFLLVVVGNIIRMVVSGIIGKKFDAKPSLTSRLCGMLISFCGFLVFFYFLLLPLYGIEEIAQKTLNEVSSVSTEYSAPSAAINDSSSSSIIYKVTTSIGKSKDGYFALPAKRFGSSTKIKIGDGEINVIKDLDPIMPNLGRFVQIKEDLDNASDKNEKVDAFKKSDIEMMINCLSNSTIISTLYKPVIGMLESNQGNEIIKRYNFDFEKLKNININEDIKKTKNFFETVYDLLQAMDLEKIDDVQTLLNDEEVTNKLSEALKLSNDSQLFKECFPKIVYYHLQESLTDSDYAFLKDVITLEYVENYLPLDIATLCEIYNLINQSKIFDKDEEGNYVLIDVNVPGNREKVENFIDKCLDLKIIEGNEGIIFKAIVNITDLSKYIEYEDSTTQIDFEKEKPLLKNVILDIFVIGNEIKDITVDISSLSDYEEISKKFAMLLDDMQKCEITKPYVFTIVDAIIKNAGYELSFTENEKNQIISNTFTAEFATLFNIIKEAETIFGSDPLENNIDVSKLEGSQVSALMKKASTSVISSRIVGTILTKALGPDGLDINPVDENGNVKYDFSTSENIYKYSDTVGNMIDVANALEKVNSTLGSVEDIDINELASSLEKLDEVSNNTELLNDMVHTICNNNDLIIDENVDWKKESEVVKEILTDYKNSEDKENYSISGNTELLEKLQDTEVAVDILKYFGITE